MQKLSRTLLGQKCCEVSTVRGRWFVAGIGSGGAGGGAWGWAASYSHKTYCGRWVRPANSLGSLERVCLGGFEGAIGWRQAVVLLGHSAQSMRKMHTSATSPRW